MMTTHVVRCAGAVPRALGVAALLLGVLATGPAAAQTPARRSLWLDAGLGIGYLRLTCASCSGIAANGAALTVTAGGGVTQNVLLGLQGQQWQSTTGGTSRQTVRSILAVVQWYPWSALRFFVRGGTGIVQGTVAPSAVGALPGGRARGTGVVIALDAGYDILLGHHFGVSLQVGEQIAGLGDLPVGGALANDVIAYVTRVGVALVWR
jgi:hypothetical protein